MKHDDGEGERKTRKGSKEKPRRSATPEDRERKAASHGASNNRRKEGRGGEQAARRAVSREALRGPGGGGGGAHDEEVEQEQEQEQEQERRNFKAIDVEAWRSNQNKKVLSSERQSMADDLRDRFGFETKPGRVPEERPGWQGAISSKGPTSVKNFYVARED